MDTLIAVGTSAAYFYSAIITILPTGSFHYGNVYFETAAIIITLILIGGLLEFRTKEKASNAVRKIDLQPRMAHVIRKQEGKEIEVEVPIEEVHEEDILGEMIPTDGKIIEDSSFLDESAITGESIPVDKTVGPVESYCDKSRTGHARCQMSLISHKSVNIFCKCYK